MRLDGRSYAEIGAELGISRQRVQQILSPPTAIRDMVRRAAKDRCQGCGVIVGKSGHVHHRDSTNGDTYSQLDNLQLLCRSCHWYAHLNARNPGFKLRDPQRQRKQLLAHILQLEAAQLLSPDQATELRNLIDFQARAAIGRAPP